MVVVNVFVGAVVIGLLLIVCGARSRDVGVLAGTVTERMHLVKQRHRAGTLRALPRYMRDESPAGAGGRDGLYTPPSTRSPRSPTHRPHVAADINSPVGEEMNSFSGPGVVAATPTAAAAAAEATPVAPEAPTRRDRPRVSTGIDDDESAAVANPPPTRGRRGVSFVA